MMLGLLRHLVQSALQSSQYNIEFFNCIVAVLCDPRHLYADLASNLINQYKSSFKMHCLVPGLLSLLLRDVLVLVADLETCM